MNPNKEMQYILFTILHENMLAEGFTLFACLAAYLFRGVFGALVCIGEEVYKQNKIQVF